MQRFILPYLSGFLAVLFFQQCGIGILHAAALSNISPFDLTPIDPFGLPGFIVSAIASGVYGILMAWLLRIDAEHAAPWIAALVFGALVPTAVRIFVIGPATGHWPTGNILPQVAFGLVSNGLWGWGTLTFIRAMTPHRSDRLHRSSNDDHDE